MQSKRDPYIIVLALVAVILAGMAFILLQNSNPADERGTLSGTVVNASDGSFVKGVSVTAVDQDGEHYTSHENSDTTGDDGFFSLELPPNDYTLMFEADGFEPFESTASYTVKKDKDTKIEEAFHLGVTAASSEAEGTDPASGTAADSSAGTGTDPAFGTAADPSSGTMTDPASGTAADPSAAAGESPSYNIPSDAVAYGGHHYYIYSDKECTWDRALSQCLARGGYLAVINDSGENEFLYQYMVEGGHEQAFFGISYQYDDWEYIAGDSSDFRDWGYNSKGQKQPNNAEEGFKQASLDTNMHDGHWSDSAFGRNTYTPALELYKDIYTYICEWDG